MSQRVMFTSNGVREAVGLPPDGGGHSYTSVSADTRTLRPGALFVALKGERHDAVDLLPEAEAKGAIGAVVPEDRSLPVTELELFGVPDTTRALGDLAAWYRQARGVRVVGITGSSGKTTVKEMAAAVLGRGYQVYKTAGNLNSQVGLPLAILKAPADADLWVLELGSSEPGEIARLAQISAPTDAVVTTVGPAHLEFFGTVDRVLEEKLALVAVASPDGTVVVGERPEKLVAGALELRPDAIVAGIGDAASWRPDEHSVGAEEVRFIRDGVEYRVPAGGRHHLADALIVAALGDALGVPAAEVARGLGTYQPLGMRSALEQVGEMTVIADCYNANPESFAAAIEYCEEAFPGRRLVAVVGTMLELGTASRAAHRQIAERLIRAHFDLVAATGDFIDAFEGLRIGRNGTGVLAADSVEHLWAALAPRLSGDEVVLVKASRGVRLDGIVDRLRSFGSGSSVAPGGEGGD
ncbi:MAG: UDP-N-acetylmuramoyl-tripeptide--D-alanyl-D-alanine ligase [Gemmatimonadales bacterium]